MTVYNNLFYIFGLTFAAQLANAKSNSLSNWANYLIKEENVHYNEILSSNNSAKFEELTSNLNIPQNPKRALLESHCWKILSKSLSSLTLVKIIPLVQPLGPLGTIPLFIFMFAPPICEVINLGLEFTSLERVKRKFVLLSNCLDVILSNVCSIYLINIDLASKSQQGLEVSRDLCILAAKRVVNMYLFRIVIAPVAFKILANFTPKPPMGCSADDLNWLVPKICSLKQLSRNIGQNPASYINLLSEIPSEGHKYLSIPTLNIVSQYCENAIKDYELLIS